MDKIIKKVLFEFIAVQMCQEEDGTASKTDECCGVGYYKQTLSDLGMTKDELKPVLIELRNSQMIELIPCVDYDGAPHGSGYFLTEDGEQYVNQHFTSEEIASVL